MVSTDRTGDNGHKLKHRKFYLNMRKRLEFFSVKVVKHWSRMPREVVESILLEILKAQLDTVMSRLLPLTLLEQGTWDDFQRSPPAS